MKPTRRHFLKTAAAIPIFGAAFSSIFARQSQAGKIPEDTIRFQLGVASYSLRNFDRAKAIEMTKRAGLKCICFKDMHLKMNSTDEECAAAAEECKKAGVTLYGCGVVYMNKPEEVENAFRYAKAAGMATIVGAPKPELLPLVDEKVKETGIYVAVHNHGPGDKIYGTPEITMDRVGKFDERIGLCIDVGHTARIGGDVVRSIRDFKDRIFDVHFKDITELSEKGTGCICGRGVLDLPSYLAAFIEIGYDRVVSFEYEADVKDPLPGLMESVGYVRGVLRMMERPGPQANDQGDPDFFVEPLRRIYRRMAEKLPEDERKKLKIDEGIFRMKEEHPELFAASPKLIESFKNGTYDSESTKATIKLYIRAFDEFDATLPMLNLYFIRHYDEDGTSAIDLELSRRVLKISVDKLKTDLNTR